FYCYHTHPDLHSFPTRRSSDLGHRVDAIRQVLPGAGNAAHHCLAAELAFGADLARHARHLAGKGIELVHHGVDGVLELENFAARSEEHTSELQSLAYLVCRLLL